jgi:hypothetical protein
MYIPPDGGPPRHRHDFEETFTVLGGELDNPRLCQSVSFELTRCLGVSRQTRAEGKLIGMNGLCGHVSFEK